MPSSSPPSSAPVYRAAKMLSRAIAVCPRGAQLRQSLSNLHTPLVFAAGLTTVDVTEWQHTLSQLTAFADDVVALLARCHPADHEYAARVTELLAASMAHELDLDTSGFVAAFFPPHHHAARLSALANLANVHPPSVALLLNSLPRLQAFLFYITSLPPSDTALVHALRLVAKQSSPPPYRYAVYTAPQQPPLPAAAEAVVPDFVAYRNICARTHAFVHHHTLPHHHHLAPLVRFIGLLTDPVHLSPPHVSPPNLRLDFPSAHFKLPFQLAHTACATIYKAAYTVTDVAHPARNIFTTTVALKAFPVPAHLFHQHTRSRFHYCALLLRTLPHPCIPVYYGYSWPPSSSSSSAPSSSEPALAHLSFSASPPEDGKRRQSDPSSSSTSSTLLLGEQKHPPPRALVATELMTCSLQEAREMPFLQSYTTRLTILRDLAEAIAFLHRAKQCHARINPPNILLRLVDGKLRARAKLDITSLANRAFHPFPTHAVPLRYLPYCAPELATDENSSLLLIADVWSFAMIACFLFVQPSLFLGSLSDRQLANLIADPAAAETAAQAWCQSITHPRLARILTKCLMADPVARCDSQTLACSISDLLADVKQKADEHSHRGDRRPKTQNVEDELLDSGEQPVDPPSTPSTPVTAPNASKPKPFARRVSSNRNKRRRIELSHNPPVEELDAPIDSSPPSPSVPAHDSDAVVEDDVVDNNDDNSNPSVDVKQVEGAGPLKDLEPHSPQAAPVVVPPPLCVEDAVEPSPIPSAPIHPPPEDDEVQFVPDDSVDSEDFVRVCKPRVIKYESSEDSGVEDDEDERKNDCVGSKARRGLLAKSSAVTDFTPTCFDDDVDVRIEGLIIPQNQREISALGTAFEHGRGVNKDLSKAVKLYRLASRKGCEDGTVHLGRCHEHGIGVNKCRDTAQHLYEQAADQDFIPGILALGKLLEERCTSRSRYVGETDQTRRALRCYRRAANSGNAEAMRCVADCLLVGFGAPKDIDTAVVMLKAAWDRGNLRAGVQLGDHYRSEDFKASPEYKFKMCLSLYEKAAERGDAEGQERFGELLFYGNGVDTDYEKAFKLFTAASKQGNIEAMKFMGECYEEGKGVEPNLEKAVGFYQKGADGGNACAMASLASCYERGAGIEVNMEKAIKLYRESAKQNDWLALNNLGVLYENGVHVQRDYIKARKLYQSAVDLGFAEAMCNLGDCFRSGHGGRKDLGKAVALYRRAVEQDGHVGAMCELGTCYYMGKGVKRDFSKAVKLFRDAANDEPEALRLLGRAYYAGHGVERDEAEAVRLFRSAIDQGNTEANLNLGICYSEGCGVERSNEKAFQLIANAAECGSREAKVLLGNMYFNGDGVKKDYEQARRMYIEGGDLPLSPP